jgi:hypothetical protein
MLRTWPRSVNDIVLGLAVSTHRLIKPTLLVFVFEGLTFVALVLTFGQTQLHLGEALRKIDPERDQGVALLVKRCAQLMNLSAMNKKLSLSRGFVIEKGAALLVLGNMGFHEIELTTFNGRIGIDQLNLTFAAGFDLGTLEHDASLELFFDVKIKTRTPIVGDASAPTLFRV